MNQNESTISLNEGWEFAQLGTTDWLPAVVPGCVHTDGAGAGIVSIDRPQLWWPNGLGEQPLYRVEVSLLSGDHVIDHQSKRIGLRQLELVRELDEWGESFFFRCNSVPFLSKGANWIPADTFVTRVDEACYRDLLGSAADANMNMLRVWGGGIYEPDIFYDICDELGICIWQDFMFACATYPSLLGGCAYLGRVARDEAV